jgi:hypothetical protein
MKPQYIMTVPSISTAHLPSSDAPKKARLYFAEYEDGFFIFIDDVPEDEWLVPIRNWLNAEFNGLNWVRFDADGEIMPELPTYDW